MFRDTYTYMINTIFERIITSQWEMGGHGRKVRDKVGT